METALPLLKLEFSEDVTSIKIYPEALVTLLYYLRKQLGDESFREEEGEERCETLKKLYFFYKRELKKIAL